MATEASLNQFLSWLPLIIDLNRDHARTFGNQDEVMVRHTEFAGDIFLMTFTTSYGSV
jgi:hypothetical protein